MRAIAIESGAFVISVPQYIPRTAFPADFPLALPERDVFGNGRRGDRRADVGQDRRPEPLYGEEGMLVYDCDLRLGLHAKRLFDARRPLLPRRRASPGLLPVPPAEPRDTPPPARNRARLTRAVLGVGSSAAACF